MWRAGLCFRRAQGHLPGATARSPRGPAATVFSQNHSSLPQPQTFSSTEEPQGSWSPTFPGPFQPQHLSSGYFHSQEQRSFLFSKWWEPHLWQAIDHPQGKQAGGAGGQHVGRLHPPTQTHGGGIWLLVCWRVPAEGRKCTGQTGPGGRGQAEVGRRRIWTLREDEVLGKPCLKPNSLGSVSSWEVCVGLPSRLGSSKKRSVIKAHGL